MRYLSPTLEAAQEAETIDPLVKIVLTHGASSYTYTRDHILDRNHPEEPYSQKATVILDNSDGALTALALQGYKGVLSYGAITSIGEEYSATAPLWVISHRFNSSPGTLDCVLSLIGIMNLMAEDKASASYMPDEDDTKSVKTLINEIVGATLACFSHCVAYEVVWESGYDTLADTYQPKDSYRIYVGGSRLASFRRALDYTGNVARVEADGKIHIFKPTTSGVVYDSQYSLESGHTFFSKAYRKRVVIPGYIVVKSQPDDDPQYSGYAKDPGYDALPAELKKQDFKQMRLAGTTQANDIAAAILSKHQLWSEMGAADVPMNVGAEVFDYVKVGAFCAEDVYRVGNLGHLTRHYNAERAEWRMPFSFGNWMTVRKALAGLGVLDPDELSEYFSRLTVKDLYVENILAKNVNFVWIDPDNNIDLSKIGDNLDNLPDGETYARVKTLHLDAGEIKLDEHILYSSGYNPTTKFDLGAHTLDNVPEGATYQRARSAALTAGGLVILDQVVVGTYGLVKSTDISAGHIRLDSVIAGTYGKVLSTDISAGHIKLKVNQDLAAQGIEIVSSSSSTRIKITSAEIAGYQYGSKQFYLQAADGKAYAGGGAVILDASGIIVKGAMTKYQTSGGSTRGYVHVVGNQMEVQSVGTHLILRAPGTYGVKVYGADLYMYCPIVAGGNYTNYLYDIKPYDTSSWIGTFSNKWDRGYFTNLPACPVPTSNSALAVIKKIKAPEVMRGKYGRRHYFKDEDFPNEMKIDIEEKNEKGKVVKVGGKEIEFVRTIGVLVEGMRELTAKVEAIEARQN